MFVGEILVMDTNFGNRLFRIRVMQQELVGELSVI